MTVQRPHIVSCRLSAREWEQFANICRKHRVTYQDMLRSLVVDAIIEEMEDALRRKQQTGREDCSETGEGCRAAT